MKCAMCNRPMLAAAASIPTRNGSINYGPVCARKAGLMPKVGPRITHVQKKAPRPGKAPANTIDVYVDAHTMNLFEEIAC